MTADERAAGASAAPPRVVVGGAFAAIYLIWGSTYLAIKYAVETVPPFLMTGVRFLTAGALLYAWSVMRSPRAPNADAVAGASRRAWADAFVVGALLIVGGTALVGWAELSVPSGMTSLILATTPLWMVLLEHTGRGARAPAPRVLAGVGVGLFGLGVLVWPSLTTSGGVDLLGAGALTASALSWSAGALYSRRAALPAGPVRATAMQMLAGAMLSLLAALVLGEHRALAIGRITAVSMIAIAYLIVAGALIAFSAYLWLMRVSTPSRVATHAYVNPVVAVLLGWAIAGESITARTAVAMAVIVVAVVLIVSAPAHSSPVPALRLTVGSGKFMRALRRRRTIRGTRAA